MLVISDPREAYAQFQLWRKSSDRIGLIPTMGALHAGHFSLVQQARSQCDLTVATIFVNPSQFGPNEDFSRYPRTLDNDLAGLRQVGTDLVFTPSVDQLYPNGFSTYVEPPAVGAPLEGVCRPGHFRGVATIVLKLFQILPANIAFFGQKDYQQLMVIRKMVEDLNLPICVQSCPTVRESDGLAMSSRNRYLQPDERLRALCLSTALRNVRQSFEAGEHRASELERLLNQALCDGPVDRVEYARVVDAETLDTLDLINRPAIALIAAFVGKTRLIDNQLLLSSEA